MNNTVKIISHLAIVFILCYLWSINFLPAKYALSAYILALFFESKVSAYSLLFFLSLLPFLVYGSQTTLAEHYAVSAYIFLSGAVFYALMRQNEAMTDFWTIDYSHIFYLITGEEIFKKKDYSEYFNNLAVHLIPLIVFAFLLLSPLFNFLLIDKK